MSTNHLCLTSRSEQQTGQIAKIMALLLAKGDCVLLSGDLGVGKSVFARELILSLILEPTDIPSPTYTFVQEYEGAQFPIRHYDMYRIEDPSDVHELGWDDNSAYLSVVEWPEKLGYLCPKICWRVEIKDAPSGRQITILPPVKQLRLHLDSLRKGLEHV